MEEGIIKMDAKEVLLKDYDLAVKELEAAVVVYEGDLQRAEASLMVVSELEGKRKKLAKACRELGIELPEDVLAKEKLAEDTKVVKEHVETVVETTKSSLVKFAKFGSKVLENVSGLVSKKVDTLKTEEEVVEETVETAETVEVVEPTEVVEVVEEPTIETEEEKETK
jgi:hypothetical protein